MKAPIRVVVVDDQDEIRKSVSELLSDSDGVVVAGEAEDGRQGIELVLRQRPDVVVMDLRMPVMDGVEATRCLQELAPRTAILVHSAHEDEDLVLEALMSGARGYVIKGSTQSDVVAAVQSVAAGRAHVSDEVTKPVVDRLVRALQAERQTRTAAEEAARRLENINRRQREFSLMSSHELRTPVTILLGALELLSDDDAGTDPQRRDLLDSARHGGRRLLRLIENLEVAAHGETLHVRAETVDVASVLDHVLADLPDGARVRSSVGTALTRADGARLAQVLHNILSNALEATPGGGPPVDVTARSPSGWVVIEVRDRGPGFPTDRLKGDGDHAPEAFELRPGASRGLGLGLWVSRRLVTAMGGDIAARNEADGGATVTIRLPSHETGDDRGEGMQR